MQTKTMTVAETLLEIKRVNASIDAFASERTATLNRNVAALVKGSTPGKPGTVIGFNNTEEEVVIATKAALQSMNDQLSYYQALRTAVTQSNIVTMLTINGQSATVQAWIDEKKLVPYRRSLFYRAATFYETLKKQAAKENASLDQLSDAKRTQMLGMGLAVELVDVEIAKFRAENTVSIINEKELLEYLENNSNKLDMIEKQLDFELNRSNVLTIVGVSW